MTQKNPNNQMRYWNIALLFSFLFMLFSLTSCSPKLITKTNKEIVKDSISYTVNYLKKDTLILIKGDTIYTSVPLHKLSETPITTKTNRGSLTLSKVRDTIYAKCEISDLKHEITLLQKEVSSFKTILTDRHTDTEIQVKYLPPIYKALSMIGVLAIILSIIIFYLNFKR